jgi:outer membrane protein assembly factor BamB
MAWNVDLGGDSVTYPLIANNLVYVLVKHALTTDARLVAVDAQTGKTIWGVDVPDAIAHAYDAGNVFVTTQKTVLAFDAMSGAAAWSNSLASQPQIQTPPTAYRGGVYVLSTQAVFGLDAATGAEAWRAELPNQARSTLAVSEEGVFFTDPCFAVYSLDRRSGVVRWKTTPSQCGNNDASASVVFGGKVYVHDHFGHGLVLDANTGAMVDSFVASQAPAFSGSAGFFIREDFTMQAVDLNSGNKLWEFDTSQNGPERMVSAPITIGDRVYVATLAGSVYGFDKAAGPSPSQWYDSVPFSFTSGESASVPAGPAAGGGVLVAPGGSHLMAWVHFDGSGADAGPEGGGLDAGPGDAGDAGGVDADAGPDGG